MISMFEMGSLGWVERVVPDLLYYYLGFFVLLLLLCFLVLVVRGRGTGLVTVTINQVTPPKTRVICIPRSRASTVLRAMY